ncbi:hypothetical protein DUI87_28835 [Hirundo rustica rustica]|uniref:SCP2 domain-containing protein n=1 Tax=Hirundo rustica rustica TaxID=333673 RepID=A0A3M0J1V0_HIRRU|nr:hypothetical protein DUI87_28835 [Hirundo rustica rustica]
MRSSPAALRFSLWLLSREARLYRGLNALASVLAVPSSALYTAETPRSLAGRGDGGGTWYIDLKTKVGSAGFGKPPVTADVVMSMSSADFVKMFTDKLKLFMAFIPGNSIIKDYVMLTLCLEKMFLPINLKTSRILVFLMNFPIAAYQFSGRKLVSKEVLSGFHSDPAYTGAALLHCY